MSGAFTWARLSYRQQRWELAFLIGGSLLLACGAAIVAWQIPIAHDSAMACVARFPGDEGYLSCRSELEWVGLLAGASTIIQGVTTVVPFAVGILLGAPLVSRELEKRTAPIAWSLASSRGWWLTGRTLPVIIVIVVALLILGQADEAMIRAPSDAVVGFQQYAMHGPLIAARGLAVFGIGVVVGLLMGRVLPAILVTGLVAVVLVAALQIARDQLMRAEATWVKADESGLTNFPIVYDQAFIDDATGELVTFDEATARFPDVFSEQGSWMPPGMTVAYFATPPERYPVFVAREMGALLVATVALGAIGLRAVRGRRPDLG